MFSKNHIIISCRNCKLHRSCHDNLISYENVYSQHETNHNKKVGISFTDLRLPSTDQWLAFTLYQFSFLKAFLSAKFKRQARFQNWQWLFPSKPFPIKYSLIFPSLIFWNIDRVIKWKMNINTAATKYIKSNNINNLIDATITICK